LVEELRTTRYFKRGNDIVDAINGCGFVENTERYLLVISKKPCQLYLYIDMAFIIPNVHVLGDLQLHKKNRSLLSILHCSQVSRQP